MKSTATNSLLTLLPAMAILMAISFSCANQTKLPEMPQEIAEINDTLRAGNIAKAISMTDLIKDKALSMGDSML